MAAVADALQFTPSAVSQQLAVLEREAGVPLLEKAGRTLRLTDAALVLVGHAEALLERAALAEADLAAAAGTVAGRGRIAAFESVALGIALPAIEALGRDAPRLRCELVEAEPEQALPALALGDLDLVLADEWQPAAAQPAGRRRRATSCRATRCGSCCRRRIRSPRVIPRRCRWPGSRASHGRPARPAWAGRR